jgi:hypothetical protein
MAIPSVNASRVDATPSVDANISHSIITDYLLCWIKLKLPDELFANIVAECPSLMRHVINELANQSSENVELILRY